jgi:hypothetical protein
MRRLLLLFLLLPFRLWACECADLPLDSIYARANVVFVGTCMDVSTNPIKGDMNVVFQVDSSWKRQMEHVATIHTPNTSCRFDFKPGKKYFVVGFKRHQTVHTDNCSSTALLPAVLPAELKKLGQSFRPGTPALAKQMNWLLIGLGAAGLLFVAVVVLRKRIFPSR